MRRMGKWVDAILLKGDIKGRGILAEGKQGIGIQRHSGRKFTKGIGRRTLKSGQGRADTEGWGCEHSLEEPYQNLVQGGLYYYYIIIYLLLSFNKCIKFQDCAKPVCRRGHHCIHFKLIPSASLCYEFLEVSNLPKHLKTNSKKLQMRLSKTRVSVFLYSQGASLSSPYFTAIILVLKR